MVNMSYRPRCMDIVGTNFCINGTLGTPDSQDANNTDVGPQYLRRIVELLLRVMWTRDCSHNLAISAAILKLVETRVAHFINDSNFTLFMSLPISLSCCFSHTIQCVPKTSNSAGSPEQHQSTSLQSPWDPQIRHDCRWHSRSSISCTALS